MKRTRAHFLPVVATLLLGAGVAQASSITYDLSWTGSGGWTMTGSFSFDSSQAGSTDLTAASLSSFQMQVFESGVSQGTWNYFVDGLQPGDLGFNFNFDAASGQFLVGGGSGGSDGQIWDTAANNCPVGFAGFASGSVSQGACANGSVLGAGNFIPVGESTLTATLVSGVPEPATIGLLGLGLAGIGLARRNRNRVNV